MFLWPNLWAIAGTGDQVLVHHDVLRTGLRVVGLGGSRDQRKQHDQNNLTDPGTGFFGESESAPRRQLVRTLRNLF